MMPSSHQPNHVSLSPSLLGSSSASSSIQSPAPPLLQQSLLSPTSQLDNTNNNASLNSNPNPFTQRQTIRSKKIKRQQGSSRFITAANKELEPLPAIKGKAKKNLLYLIEMNSESKSISKFVISLCLRCTGYGATRTIYQKVKTMLYCV